jgi:DNA-directed RNA polymerase subunit K/omega
MLIEPDVQAMLHNKDFDLGNKFYLLTLLRKRSANLVDGSPPLIENPCINPVSTALHEIAQGKVRIRRGTDQTIETTDNSMIDPQVSALAAALGY